MADPETVVTMEQVLRRFPNRPTFCRNEAAKTQYWYLRENNGSTEGLSPEMRAEFAASGAELLYRVARLTADLPDEMGETATIFLRPMMGHPAIEIAFRYDPERWARMQEALASTVRAFVSRRPFPDVRGNTPTPGLGILLRFGNEATNLWPFDFSKVPDGRRASPGAYFQLYYHALAVLRKLPPYSDTEALMKRLEGKSSYLRKVYGRATTPDPLEFLHDSLIALLSGKLGWHIPCPFEELLSGMLRHRYLKQHRNDSRNRRLQPLPHADDTTPDPGSDHSIATLERLYLKQLQERLPVLLDTLVREGKAYVLPTLQGLLQIYREDGSILELARRLGVTPHTVYNHLSTVQRFAKGLI